MSRRSTLLGAILAALVAAPANADLLCLKDGRFLFDKEMRRTEGGIQVQFENGEVFVPDDLIREAVLRSDEVEPKTDKEREQLAKGRVRFRGRWVTPERRDELVEEFISERRTAMERERKEREWANRRKKETKHFAFEYTIPEPIFEEYSEAMEAYFKDFAKRWRVKVPRDVGRVLVCFYSDRDRFNKVSGARGGTVGFFRNLEPFELHFYYDRLDPRYTEEVMFHETNHYLQKLIDLRFRYPHWPGEGLAEYYGATTWDPEEKELATGLPLEGRLAQIESDIAAGRTWTIDELILDANAFAHYTWGWSLVHFLMNHPKYEKKFQKFYVDLAHGKRVQRDPVRVGGDHSRQLNLFTCTPREVLRAFKDALGITKQDKLLALERDWHAHVHSLLEELTTRGLEKAAFQAYWSGRPIRAQRLFEEAIDAGSGHPLVFQRYGILLTGADEHALATEAFRQSIALDPINPTAYLSLGRSLLEQGANDEARPTMLLAKELDPDDELLRESVADILKELEEAESEAASDSDSD